MSASSRSLEQFLTDAWQRRGLLACALWPLSLVFCAVASLRRGLYRSGWRTSVRLPVPVIVVGNVFIGGTGKTPLVIWLVEQLRSAGHVPGVISRGHGADSKEVVPVTNHATVQQVGDEPLLIAQRSHCPVVVGRDRVAAGQKLLALYPKVSVIISDDGLQHYRLQRTIEIVLFDQRGGGNGWLLPAGPLREPLSRTRDFTVFNGAAVPAGFPADTQRMALAGSDAVALADGGRRKALNQLDGPILAAAGIGNPERFFAMLRAAGLVIATMPLPDHFDFIVNPFVDVTAAIILITEKDAVKCARIDSLKNDPRLWVVPVTARIDGPLAELIVEKLRGFPTA